MRSKLVLQQLSGFEDEAVLYKNIGKAYVCTPKKAIIDSFEHECKEHSSALEKQMASRKRLEDNVTSVEGEFKELLSANPAIGHAFMQSAGA